MKKGYVQVYTGNGKGKTTAALGLALRAAGAGLNIWIGQFVKGREYSEHKALKRFENMITIRRFGRRCFIKAKPGPGDIKAALSGLKEAGKAIVEGKHHLVILDEACIALHFKLFTIEELLEIIQKKPRHVELVITGRYAPQMLIEAADLVTEMKEVKHYYSKGVKARRGIES